MFDFLTVHFPWLGDFLVLLAGVGLIAFMIYWARAGASGVRGFVIHVDEEEITFSGEFPAGMQAMVTEFLRKDVQAPGPYQVRGRWDRESQPPRLIVVVKGAGAQAYEQRIRNFLKLNVKLPK